MAGCSLNLSQNNAFGRFVQLRLSLFAWTVKDPRMFSNFSQLHSLHRILLKQFSN